MAYFFVQFVSFPMVWTTSFFIVFYCSSEHCKDMETRGFVKSLYVAIWTCFYPLKECVEDVRGVFS